MVEQSILRSIAQLLGITEDHTYFDTQLIDHINTALFGLTQLGIGPQTGFRITDDKAKWTDILGTRQDLDAARSYVYQKVRLAFDPPQMGYFVDAIKDQIKELEWRLVLQAEGGDDS